jgi:TonB-linked SusC/RagA family outer membrane protein
MKQILYGLLLFSYPLISSCQSITINGKIIDENGKPIPNATITIKQSNKKTISDQYGLFTIHDSRLTDTLIVSAVGYETTEEPNNVRGLITITLKRKITTLAEVIVSTGYQDLPQERATGSFEKIDADLLNRSVSTDFLSRLEGVSSVYFDKRGIGSGAFSIRGRSTIFANAVPLIVVDNFPYDGDINNINPDDIESITILKDAAAASIWGVRAGNGVIVINTKKGKYKKSPALQFNSSITIGKKPDLFYAPAISSSDFIDVETFLFGKGFYNGDISNSTTRPPISPVVEILAKRRAGQLSATDSATQIDALRKLDVRNDLLKYFYRNSFTQQYTLSYSGGSDNMTYFLSAGYDRIFPNLLRNNSNRITFNSAASYTPVKFLEFTVSAVYTGIQSLSGNPAQNITSGGNKSLYPYAQLADENGNPLPIIKDYRYSFIDTAGAGKLLDWKYRPLQELNEANNKTNQSDYRFDFTTSFKYNDHFSLAVLYRFEKQTAETKNLYSQNTYIVRNLVNRFYNPATNKYGVPLGEIMDRSFSSLLSHNGRLQANYSQTWQGVQDITAIAGAEIKQTQMQSSLYRVYGYSDDVLTYTNVDLIDNLPVYGGLASSQPIPNPENFSAGVLRFVSLFANAAYTYNKKYTASFSARRDASNLFGVASNQKWVPLWSSGLSWQLDKEKFYRWNRLPYLRLRLTYGYNGNVDNSLSAFTTLRYTSGALFTSQQYAIVQNPPNPELQWEKTAVLNFGLDFSFKNDRISGSLEYYRKTGKDLIGFSPVDPTTGVQSTTLTFTFKGNVAAMKGNGFDLILNTHNLIGKLKWTSNLIFDYAASKVTRYLLANTNASSFLNYGTSINPVPGRPLYAIYSYPWAGLDPATGDPQGFLNGVVSKNYTALTNVTVDDLVYKGSAVPLFFGSLRNTFSWKNFSLSANILFKLDYYFRRTSVSYTSLFNNWIGHSDYIKRWQKPGDENFTNVPSLIYPNSNVNRDNFYISSEPLVERGDHIRLQDIALSYSIPGMKKKLPFKNLQVYTYMDNIGILWKANKAGLDPDYFSGGYPLPFTISFGIKTNF